jgi:hypothetical protein
MLTFVLVSLTAVALVSSVVTYIEKQKIDAAYQTVKKDVTAVHQDLTNALKTASSRAHALSIRNAISVLRKHL